MNCSFKVLGRGQRLIFVQESSGSHSVGFLQDGSQSTIHQVTGTGQEKLSTGEDRTSIILTIG